MPEKIVTCSKCQTSRKINRRYLTQPMSSFWCTKCSKEVACLEEVPKKTDEEEVLTLDNILGIFAKNNFKVTGIKYDNNKPKNK